ncbi:MAG: DNA/RNA nuclease SfsA [Sumerlaeia bacterium]
MNSPPAAAADPFPVVIPREEPLIEGRLLGRYNRFLSDIELPGGEVVTAHCVNTGAMEGLCAPGTRVWISRADNPNRKLKFTWEMAEAGGHVYGANTAMPNRIVGELLERRALPWLAKWDELRPECPYGENCRVDFRLKFGRRYHFLEVKNVHLYYPDGRAYFPDSVSERGANHLRELSALLEPRKASAEVLFFVQIPAAKAIRPSDAHDPAFAAAARAARQAGVRFRALRVAHTAEAIHVLGTMPVDLKPYNTERPAAWRKANKENGSSGWKRR